MTPDASQQPLWGAGPLVVLGLDPGSRVTGWGVVRRSGRNLSRIASGVLRPRAAGRLDYRLAVLRDGVLRLLEEHQPAVVACETPYVPQPRAVPPMTAEEVTRMRGQLHGCLVLAQARGAVAAAVGCIELRLGEVRPFVEVAPTSVKSCCAGTGRAKKDAVAEGVRRVLGLGRAAMEADESDALGVAICAALTWRPK